MGGGSTGGGALVVVSVGEAVPLEGRGFWRLVMRGHPKSERFFTSEEKERLKTVTHEIESKTIGEIVVMVVDHSDHYIEAEVLGSILLGSLLSLILTVLFFHSSIWSYIP